jgi:hypothetical protein
MYGVRRPIYHNRRPICPRRCHVTFVHGGVFTIIVIIVPHSNIGGVRSFPSTTEYIFNSDEGEECFVAGR